MTDAAEVVVGAFTWAAAFGIFGEAAGPGHFVGVDVEDAVFDIDCRAAPFGTTIKAGEDDSLLSDGERDELAVAAEGAELIKGVFVSLWSAISQGIFGEALTGEWFGCRGLGLGR